MNPQLLKVSHEPFLCLSLLVIGPRSPTIFVFCNDVGHSLPGTLTRSDFQKTIMLDLFSEID
jgi:hypothetical protein